MKKASSMFELIFARCWIRPVCFVMAGLLLCPAVRAQTTWYVATDGNDASHSGTNGWADAYLTISNAVAKSSSSDEIWVAAGAYVLTTEINIPAGKNIHLLGVEGRDLTTINANNSSRGMYVLNGRVGGFTITNGNNGGVYLTNAIMTNCIISGNQRTSYGGGVYLGAGSVLSNCIVRGNRVTGNFGGGIYIADNGGGQVWNCWIENNISSSNGGGCYIERRGLVENSVISGNTAAYHSGGVYVWGTLSHSTISSNTARFAGGAYLESSAAGLYNSTICGNTALLTLPGVTNAAGGVYFSNGCRMTNCLIYGNQALNGSGGGVVLVRNGDVDSCTIVGNTANRGGGIYSYWSSSGTMYVRNTIVYSNEATTGPNWWYEVGSQYTYFTNCCITNTTMPLGSGFITNSPKFVDPPNHNYRLEEGSPCINAGLNQSWMVGATDLDGRMRLDRFSGILDIGAYEYVSQGTLFSF